MTRNDILDTAKTLINGDRARDYGDAYLMHARIAALWTTYVRSKTGDLKPVDVAMMLVLMKVARSIETPQDDSFVDIAGYAALAGEISNVGS
jgi:hypothetical protein